MVEDVLVPSDGVSYHTKLNVLILVVVEDVLVLKGYVADEEGNYKS